MIASLFVLRGQARAVTYAFYALIAAAAALIASVHPAAAFDWRLDSPKSAITFNYTEDGAPAAGTFGRFEAFAQFDERRPEDARMRLTIHMSSIKLSDGFRTDFVKNPTWFHTAAFPRAVYELESLEALGGDRYRASGRLTLKDVTRPLVTELTLKIDGENAVASGRIAFNRFDHNVGDKLAALWIDVGADIAVDFNLVARRN